MTESHASHLAERFRDDARSLRARADVLDAPGARRTAGPTAAACRAMADACEHVGALFANATDDAALAATIPALEAMLAAERAPDTKHVYAGAITRVRQTLGDDDDEDDDDDEEDDG